MFALGYSSSPKTVTNLAAFISSLASSSSASMTGIATNITDENISENYRPINNSLTTTGDFNVSSGRVLNDI